MERLGLIAALTGVSALTVFSGLTVPLPVTQPTRAELVVGATPLSVEVADDDISRVTGLSGRTLIPEGTGMLFVFGAPGRYAMWMKDMKFPVDIIWLDRFGRISYIVESAAPEISPSPYAPPEDAWYVLETRAGFVQQNAVQVGDGVFIPAPW